MRAPITLEMDMMDLVITMAEGNPGAMVAITTLLNRNELGVIRLVDLDDMNMRGAQIWVAYKDYCDQDEERFRAAIEDRDPEMIAYVNNEMAYSGEVAVRYGGSYRGRTR